MATWIGRDLEQNFLKVLEKWRESCLLRDGGMFTNENLWTAANFQNLEEIFDVNSPSQEEGLYQELRRRLANSEANLIKLAAEVLWFFLLFVSDRAISVDMKTKEITETWELSKERFPPLSVGYDRILHYDLLVGIAYPGTYFRINLWKEFGFLLTILKEWKSLLISEQLKYFPNKPWILCQWVSTIQGKSNPTFRHMFLYFCYPKYFERICSKNHKELIYRSFSNLLENSADPYKENNSPCGLDESLYEIRKKLESKYETTKLDFYEGPINLKSQWLLNGDTPKLDSLIVKSTIEAATKDLFIDTEKVEHVLQIWRSRKNLIIQGAPGVGKTFAELTN